MTIKIILISLLLSPLISHAKKYEKHYQQEWCQQHQGKTEVSLKDRTRIDCETATHVIEFDFAKKWAESIGQSLYYALKTGKKAGIVLILTRPKDSPYYERLNSTISHYKLPITVWTIEDYYKQPKSE